MLYRGTKRALAQHMISWPGGTCQPNTLLGISCSKHFGHMAVLDCPGTAIIVDVIIAGEGGEFGERAGGSQKDWCIHLQLFHGR